MPHRPPAPNTPSCRGKKPRHRVPTARAALFHKQYGRGGVFVRDVYSRQPSTDRSLESSRRKAPAANTGFRLREHVNDGGVSSHFGPLKLSFSHSEYTHKHSFSLSIHFSFLYKSSRVPGSYARFRCRPAVDIALSLQF